MAKLNEESDGEEFLGFKPIDVEIARKRGVIRVRQMSDIISKKNLSVKRKFQTMKRNLLRGGCRNKKCNHNIDYLPMVVYEPQY